VATSTDLTFSFYVRNFGIMLLGTSTVALVFLPKLLSIWFEDESTMGGGSTGSNLIVVDQGKGNHTKISTVRGYTTAGTGGSGNTVAGMSYVNGPINTATPLDTCIQTVTSLLTANAPTATPIQESVDRQLHRERARNAEFTSQLTALLRSLGAQVPAPAMVRSSTLAGTSAPPSSAGISVGPNGAAEGTVSNTGSVGMIVHSIPPTPITAVPGVAPPATNSARQPQAAWMA